ncbi:DUF4440 domain-containing protein [Allonocardiopsis opalescens]|uniref:Uncharacterized protein DUF4440 n=1 Tax=Allonocardiopsis opalescens TaxID=1144618 RepID=A0A2T0QAU3_9ACTN|nr:DUF4440 domain-containing protein [Allonocardiopsis opalescens]PRY00963.1 uncharacterized protein DUF4440 [Allonocardiopsis opalescens]
MTTPTHPELLAELLEREHAGWRALSAGTGAYYYDAELTDDAVMVLPFGVGVLERAESIAAMAAAPPWSAYAIERARALPLGPDGGLLVYAVAAERKGQPPYSAEITSGYRRTADGWRLAFHQQTPAGPPA